MRRATGRTLHVPTLAERLRWHNEMSIVCSNVSPGAAYFQDPDRARLYLPCGRELRAGSQADRRSSERGAEEGRRRRPGDDRPVLRRDCRRARAGAGADVAQRAGLYRSPLPARLAAAPRSHRRRRPLRAAGVRDRAPARSVGRGHIVRDRLRSRHGDRVGGDRHHRRAGRRRAQGSTRIRDVVVAPQGISATILYGGREIGLATADFLMRENCRRVVPAAGSPR